MHVIRLLLLALLAVTLPVRGVMAAAMLCPPPALAGHGHAMQPAAVEPGPTGDGGAHVHAATDPDAAGGSQHHDGAGTDTCNLCSACCSMPPLASAGPSVALRRDLGTSAFPALTVPPPDFLSGGQERPPRSI